MQLHDPDAAAARSTFGRGVRLHRFGLSEDVDVCVCAYQATSGSRWRAVANRLELGVQLRGAIAQRAGTRSHARRYEAGSVHVLSPGEAYDAAYAAGPRPGLAVWFSLDVERLSPDTERELRATADGEPDRALEDAARLVCDNSCDATRLAAWVRPVLDDWVHRRCELSRPDAVVAARRLIDRTFDRELYLHHLAQEVGLHPTRLLRRFAARYGVTPIQYRIRTRLNQADRLAWARPDLDISEIATSCGFPNLSYFYRQFTGYFGTTPARHRQNTTLLG